MSKITFIILSIGVGVSILSLFLFFLLSGKTPETSKKTETREDLLYLCNSETSVCGDTRVLRNMKAILKIYPSSEIVLGVNSSECVDLDFCFAEDERGIFWTVEK